MTEQRFERGLEMLQRIDGRAGGEMVAELDKICPDMGRLIVEFPTHDFLTTYVSFQ